MDKTLIDARVGGISADSHHHVQRHSPVRFDRRDQPAQKSVARSLAIVVRSGRMRLAALTGPI